MTTNHDEWIDERMSKPLALHKIYGSWLVTIEEFPELGRTTGIRYRWSVRRDKELRDWQQWPYADGSAPTLEAAKRVIEHILLDYAIKIPISA